jgi:hypothetical protein
MAKSNLEISCPACGKITLLRREPVYEGFTKTGETLSCSGCGETFGSEADVPFNMDLRPEVFTESDRSDSVEVFDESEKQRVCRYCMNYTVNPFTQWCSLHKKDVEATDTCDKFKKRESESPDS